MKLKKQLKVKVLKAFVVLACVYGLETRALTETGGKATGSRDRRRSYREQRQEEKLQGAETGGKATGSREQLKRM